MSNNYPSTMAIPGAKAAYARPEVMLRAAFVALLLFTHGITRGQGPQNPRVITINSVSATAGCSGQPVTVSYTATGNYNAHNTFIARLLTAANTTISESTGLPDLTGTLSLPIPVGTAANTYRIVVASTQLNNVLSSGQDFRVQPVIQIVTQPASQAVEAFSPVTFSVSATGESLTYQWFKNGAILSGATTAAYTLPAATAADAGTYSVQVAGVCETKSSNVATLTINKRIPTLASLSTPAAISYNQAVQVSGKISTTVNGIERIPSGAVQVFANSASTSLALGSAPIAADGTFAAELPANAALGASTTPYALSFVYPGDPNFTAANDDSRQMMVNKAKAQLLVGGLVQSYDGTPKEVTITTEPAGLATTVSYSLPPASRVNTGTYAYAASLVSHPNYEANPVSGTFTVNKAIATLTLVESSLNQVYDGQPKPVTVTVEPANLTGVSVRYNGGLTPPVNATDYTVDVALYNLNYQATSIRRVLRVNKAIATLTLVESSLNQVYDGQPKPVTVTVEPANLTGVSVRYNGGPTAPANIGSYMVDVALNNINYQAVALSQKLTISAPTTAAAGQGSAAARTSAARVATTTSPAAEQPATFSLNAYPNPFAGKFTLSIGSEVAGDVAITVMDGKGRSVTRQVVQAAGPGSRTVEIDLSGENAGLYLLNVQSGARREVVKVFKNNR